MFQIHINALKTLNSKCNFWVTELDSGSNPQYKAHAINKIYKLEERKLKIINRMLKARGLK